MEKDTMLHNPNLYTISQTEVFLDVLIEKILSGDLPRKGGKPPSKEELAHIILYLPTPQAIKKVQARFLEYAIEKGQSAIMLPCLRNLSIVEYSDNTVLASSNALHIESSDYGDNGPLNKTAFIAPAMSLFEQRILLTKELMLIMKNMSADFKRISETLLEHEHITLPLIFSDRAHDALSLVEKFRSFLNHIAFDNIKEEHVDDVLQEMFTGYKHDDVRILTLVVLQQLRQAWQNICKAKKKQSHISCAMEMLSAYTLSIKQSDTKSIIIAAGSTASTPQTSLLLKTIAHLDNGAVILPGFDNMLGSSIYSGLPMTHPQYYMQKFTQECGCEPKDVINLDTLCHEKSGWKVERLRLIQNILLPGKHITQWVNTVTSSKKNAINVTENIHILETDTDQEEVMAIATLLRKTLEKESGVTAFVTANRALIDKVKAYLAQQDIFIHDTSGVSLLHTAEVKLFMLLCDSFIPRFSLIHFMSFIKNSLLQLTTKEQSYVRDIEYFIREKCNNKKNLDTIIEQLNDYCCFLDSKSETKEKKYKEFYEAYLWLKQLHEHFFLFLQCIKTSSSFHSFLEAHLKTLQSIAPSFYECRIVQILRVLIESFVDKAHDMPPIEKQDYRHLLEHFLKEERVADNNNAVNPRVYISSFWEMRLMNADCVIMGGMNEGVFPQHPQPDFWLTQDLSQKIGLRDSQSRIGQAAHDFSQLCGNKEIWLCRSKNSAGQVTFPSRFFFRMQVFLKGSQANIPKKSLVKYSDSKAESLLYFIRNMHNHLSNSPYSRQEPKPNPPLYVKPLALSQSSLTRLIHNPYDFYAQHILKLKPMKSLERALDAMDFGIIMHKIIAACIQELYNTRSAHNHSLEDIQDCMQRHCNKMLNNYRNALSPYQYELWLKRAQIITHKYASIEKQIQQKIESDYIEVEACDFLKHDINKITLQVRADRIIKKRNAGYMIIDYKTGQLPSKKDFAHMLYPQLLLEALLLKHQKYPNINTDQNSDCHVEDLVYVTLQHKKPAYHTYANLGEKDSQLLQDFTRFLNVFIEKYLSDNTLFLYNDGTHYNDYQLLARRI